MTIDEIKELILVFNDSGVAEMEVHRGGNSLRLKRAGANHEMVLPLTAAPVLAAAPSSGASNTGTAHASTPAVSAAAAAKQAALDEAHELVKSPIVGTYYDAPAPGAAPFVRVGDNVESGQVLCIIESMKLMNEIESEMAGTVMAKLVENGRPVEYGEALFAIRPR
jgi:acetyl-CoA carboxylase biotin carboxyl carrier protein